MRLLVNHQATPVKRFGGLVTEVPRENLPVGDSPDCANVVFEPTSVKSRFGTSIVATGDATLLDFLGMDSMALPVGRRLITMQTAGKLYYKESVGALTEIDDEIGLGRVISAPMFNRAAIAFGNRASPSTWDGTNRDRFTYGAPGRAPVGADTGAGVVDAGYHSVAVCNVMRGGFITPPVFGNVWNAVGTPQARITNIGIGPPACVARMVFLSIVNAGGANGPYVSSEFFHIPSLMYIADNTATTIDINASDVMLLAGEPLSSFVGVDPIADALQILQYNQRSVVVGETPVIRPRDNAAQFVTAITPEAPTALNLRFDGGPLAGTTPYAWSVIGGSPNGSFANTDGAVNPCWLITSDGATANQGHIRNGISVGASNLEAAVALNQEVGVRLRIKIGGALFAAGTGQLTVALRDSFAVPTYNLTATFDLTALFAGYFQPVSATLGTLTSYGTSLAFDYWMSSPGTAGQQVWLEGVELYRVSEFVPAVSSNSTEIMRVSRPFEPEAFDSTTGFVAVGPGDGDMIRGAFYQGGTLYVAKSRSLWSVVDDNVNEPASWVVRKVSDTVGIPNPRCIGYGDGWFALLSREGLYRFSGASAQKLSEEIDPTWDSIVWSKNGAFWCVVQEKEHRIYCGVALDDDVETGVDTVLVMDFREGFGRSQRKWTPWDGTPAAASAQVVQVGSSEALYFGGASSIYKYDTDYRNDSDAVNDDTAITAYYETASIGADFDVRLTSAIRMSAQGEQVSNVVASLASGEEVLVWQVPLEATAETLEHSLHLGSERLFVKIQSGELGTWWQLLGLEVWQMPRWLTGWRGRRT